jgi:hypothetical protein
MKAAITGTFNKIPKKTNSHTYGWARTWSENLGVPLNQDAEPVDILYMDHGANFGGSINLFGGFTDELKQRIQNMMESEIIVSLDRDMPDYGEMLKKRKDVTDKDWCDRITEKLSTATTLISSDLQFDKLAIGDSHTAAYADHNSCVVKQDGTTLFSQVRTDFEYIKNHIKPHHKSLTISLGNIDVRHHILRLDVDWKYMYNKLFIFGDSLGIDVEYSLPWPIEFEERKLPKSGWYKGHPFYGSRIEREELVWSIYDYMVSNSVNIVKAPADWYKMDPEQYAKERMEGTSSVHLNPNFYRRMNWGQPTNSLEAFF